MSSKDASTARPLTYDDVSLTDEELEEEISIVQTALHLFLNSKMVEAEKLCDSKRQTRLCYSIGYALIQSIKALATFETEDLAGAIERCKETIVITQLLRKGDSSLFETLGRMAKGSASLSSVQSMTVVQRHAELIYAECTLLKAAIAIIYSGDFLSVVKEGLSFRAAYATYRVLGKFVETADELNGGEEDPSIDHHLRSGIFLGNGMISLMLSLLPSSALKVMSIFGVDGDRECALATLMKAGGWVSGQEQPGRNAAEEGLRRPMCDMILLTHHLVISNYLPVGDADIPLASSILDFELGRFPNGVFFLCLAGRLHSTKTDSTAAIATFHRAIDAQVEYIQLQHICYWELGLVSLSLGDYEKSLDYFTVLESGSNWSKAIYAYARATSMYEQANDIDSIVKIMESVPNLTQKIAGKSVPLEKLIARRARKFIAQGNRLTLAGIELAYILNSIGLSPRNTLIDVHLKKLNQVVAELDAIEDPADWGNGTEYWDDYCLAQLLQGVVLRLIAHPEPHAIQPSEVSSIAPEDADVLALTSFKNVLEHGSQIQDEQHLVWFAHYELGRLYDLRRETELAKKEYSLVLSGKIPEMNRKKGSGKVSLQSMVVLRAASGLRGLRE